uniref:C2H2-type domain-containing protein n=1 Tax=Arundo donax TaxID=35708 RepID=A0A0A9GYB4_ARUDO
MIVKLIETVSTSIHLLLWVHAITGNSLPYFCSMLPVKVLLNKICCPDKFFCNSNFWMLYHESRHTIQEIPMLKVDP